MSMESAKSFLERMKNDEDFRKKVTECKDNESRKSFVLKEGFDFTLEEMNKSRAELSEEDLNSISAGWPIVTLLCLLDRG